MKTSESKQNAILTIGNKTYELPIYDATHGPSVIDVSAL